MKKSRILFVLAMAMIFIVCATIGLSIFVYCYNHRYDRWYDEWKTITLESPGTLKIPQEWVVTEQDGTIYVTDRPLGEQGCTIYLVGTGECLPYELFKDTKLITFVDGENYSNSAGYRLEQYEIEGRLENRYTIDLYGTQKCMDFIVWDPSITKETVLKITKSYQPE